LPYSALSGRFGKEWLDNLLHFSASTFWALNFFGIVLFDGQDFGSFLTALKAEVFVDWHSVRLVIGFS
jgi:hypothetical protein